MHPSKRQVLQALKGQGWLVEEDGSAVLELPEPVRSRYPALPASLAEFLGGLRVCANAWQTAWFLCQEDFAGRAEAEWRWNEFELMALNWFPAEQEQQEREAVVNFWDSHFPFLLSVYTGYAFFAVSLRPETKWQVVRVLLESGEEDAVTVAASFEEFLPLLLAGQFPAEVGDAKPAAV